MKLKIKKLSSKLKDVHRIFLENERKQAEQYFEKKIAPFEFVVMLTQDKGFEWLRPFSAFIAELDAFTDSIESEDKVTKNDVAWIRSKIDDLMTESRYTHHLNLDPDFIMSHAALKKELKELQ